MADEERVHEPDVAEPGTPQIRGIELLPVGSLPDALARDVAERLSRRVHVPCRTRARDRTLVAARLGHRDQVDADAFLRQVEGLARPPGVVTVGLTGEDMGHPIFTFFFGRARRHGPAAVVSAKRLSPAFYGLPDDDHLTAHRTALEIVHELGHVGGLGHCGGRDCIMHFTTGVESLDLRGTEFCATCKAVLPRGLGG